ncbi:MAG: hypothetical protein AAB875_05860 [Patescibacteria group bacterium]
MVEKKQETLLFWVLNLGLLVISWGLANVVAVLTRLYLPDTEIKPIFMAFPIVALLFAVWGFSMMAKVQGTVAVILWGFLAMINTLSSFVALGFFAALEAPKRTELFAMDMLVALFLVLTSLYILKEAVASPRYQDLVFTVTGGFGLFLALALLNLV